ncbi:MAG: hypothetical protein IKE70_04755 [Bacilli bacterium]|nr:hypothetical protein [Bacilli bacterium]
MSIIIPYKEKEIYDNDGAFIKLNGEIIYTHGLHETFSRNYCNGYLYNQLYSHLHPNSHLPKYDEDKIEDYFEYLKAYYNFKGTIEEIEEYSSTKLTKEQLNLYKLWLERYELNSTYLFSDFLVYVLQFDKVETVMRETITTTNPNPHIRFFNYYLMDWYIIEQPPMKYNKKKEIFEYEENGYLGNQEDKESEEEIEEIRRKVLKKDRPLFFK